MLRCAISANCASSLVFHVFRICCPIVSQRYCRLTQQEHAVCSINIVTLPHYRQFIVECTENIDRFQTLTFVEILAAFRVNQVNWWWPQTRLERPPRVYVWITLVCSSASTMLPVGSALGLCFLWLKQAWMCSASWQKPNTWRSAVGQSNSCVSMECF